MLKTDSSHYETRSRKNEIIFLMTGLGAKDGFNFKRTLWDSINWNKSTRWSDREERSKSRWLTLQMERLKWWTQWGIIYRRGRQGATEPKTTKRKVLERSMFKIKILISIIPEQNDSGSHSKIEGPKFVKIARPSRSSLWTRLWLEIVKKRKKKTKTKIQNH